MTKPESSAPIENTVPARAQVHWRRPLAVLTASLLLHLLAFDLVRGRIGQAVVPPRVEQVITASLEAAALPAPVPPPEAQTPPPPKPAEPVPVKPRKITPPAESPAAIADNAVMPESVPAEPPRPVQPESPAVVATAADPLPEPPPAPAPAAAPAAANAVFKVVLPPSAEVYYDVQALRDGKTVYGSGKISWRSSGDSYVIDGEAGILFFSVLTFKSEGSLDNDGITPLRYSEKRFRKAATNTHFQRDPKVISFSASTASYPRSGGEQDRASIIWQLAAIGRGDPAQFTPGAELAVFVAGVRDAETWSIKVIGQEPIEVGGEKISAWHLVRMPRAGSFDTQVDIWLAPSREWYPVKLRQTERNGDYLDMSMSKITPL